MTAQRVTQLPWGDFSRRLAELAEVYLEPPYDHLIYVIRGGMTPAHRLAHVLRLQGEHDTLLPIVIKRHREDAIQAEAQPPRLESDLLALRPGSRVLLVDDTIGAGETLAVAVEAIGRHLPARLDVVSVGLDHQDWTTKGIEAARTLVAQAVIGFDYWGWMVFPWENQSREAPSLLIAAGAWRPHPPIAVRWPAPALDALADADRPGCEWRLVTGVEADSKRAFRLPQLAKFAFLPDDKVLELASVSDRSLDLLVLDGLAASRMPLVRFSAWLRVAASALKPGGRLVFDHLDRTRVAGEGDLHPGEYFTGPLLERLFSKAGLAPDGTLGHSGVVTIAAARRP